MAAVARRGDRAPDVVDRAGPVDVGQHVHRARRPGEPVVVAARDVPAGCPAPPRRPQSWQVTQAAAEIPVPQSRAPSARRPQPPSWSTNDAGTRAPPPAVSIF